MVKLLRVHAVLILLVTLFSAQSHAAQLRLELAQQHIELGQALSGKIIAIDNDEALTDTVVEPLREDFNVTTQPGELTSNQSAHYAHHKIQVLDLTLIPRRMGELKLPVLTLNDVQTQPHKIVVDKAMEIDGPIQIAMHVSSHRVWQRQQLLVTVDIKTPQPFAGIDGTAFKLSGFEIVPLDTKVQDLHDDPHFHTHIIMGWAIFPLLAGHYSLDLPLINYEYNGRVHRRFALPQTALTVSSLPAYIPPNMPVAKVSITSSVKPNGVLRTDRLAYWTVTLKANGTLPYWLPPVLQTVHSTANLKILPAHAQRKLSKSPAGVTASIVQQIPFKVLHSGKVSLPVLKLQYFDPVRGRIHSLRYRSPTPYGLSPTLTFLLLAGIVIIVFLTLRALYRWLHVQATKQRQLREAIKLIESAKTSAQIMRGLKCYAQARGWPSNLCVSDFITQWQQHYVLPDNFKNALHGLSEYAYSSHTMSQTLSDYQRIIVPYLHTPRHNTGRYQPRLISID